MRIEPGAYFARSVREQLFVPSDPDRRLVGASLEVIPLLVDTGRVCAIQREGGISSVALLRRFGAMRGWREGRDGAGTPRFFAPDATRVSFGAGGQIAVTAAPRASIDELVQCLTSTLMQLGETARRMGIELVTRGIDPRNNVLDVPLQVESERNSQIASYLDAIGPSGARYMRQSAGLTVHLDAGHAPGARWRLLSNLSPYLTAIFASSRHYAGLDSGLQSYRAYCRRTMDSSRTAAPADGDARDSYLDFALDAVDPFRRRADGRHVSYRDWIASGEWSEESWERHLATLYPEVRPCGHLALHAIDAMPLEWLAAPIVLVCGLVYDVRTSAATASLVGDADDAVLWRAAGLGLHDPTICTVAREVVELALSGARSLDKAYVSARHLAATREFVERYTLRGRAPADDAPMPLSRPKQAPRLVVINGAFGFA